MRFLPAILVPGLLAGCAVSETARPTESPQLRPDDTVTARTIVELAHKAAGGESWLSPRSLYMDGYAVFYDDHIPVRHETHRMWRVYPQTKTDARRVDGKVRIRSQRNGAAVLDLAYDGTRTYTPDGFQAPSDADQRWASNFGFGVIRHALEPGYRLSRLPDDLVDGRPVFAVRVTDPAGGTTQFGIARSDHAILRVAFDTPRGWHERVYSDFFTNPGHAWVQPGRVRLYYDGVKANEVIWTAFAVDQLLPDCLFVLPEVPGCRTGDTAS